MTDDLKDVLRHVSDPADVAVVLIAGTAGFLIDAGLNAVGFLEPGYVGVATASGALGMKKAVEATVAKGRVARARRRELEQAERKAGSLLVLLREKGHGDLMGRLEREVELFRAEIIDLESFESNVGKVVDAYRSRPDPDNGKERTARG